MNIFSILYQKLKFQAKPNSFLHTKSIDVLSDAKSKKITFYLWILQNFIISLISKPIKILILLYEKITIKKK